MAYIITGGREGFNKNLDIFSIPPTETGIQEKYEKEYKPISVFSAASPVMFQIENPSADYIDMHNIKINLAYKIMTDKNEAVKVAKNLYAGPINLTSASFFSQCDLFLNQINVNTGTGNNYPYKAYIDTVLSSGLAAKNSFLPAAGFYKDSAGAMDDFTGVQNLGLKARAALTLDEKIAKVTGYLYTDFTDQEQYLINGIPVGINLRNCVDEFRLMWDGEEIPTYALNTMQSSDYGYENSESSTNYTTAPPVKKTGYKLVLEDVTLIVPFIKLHSGLFMQQNKMLIDKPAVYPFTRSEIKTFTLPASVGDWCGQNIFNDKIPKQIIICLMDSLAYAGNAKKNPFNFHHYNVTDISYEVNNRIINRPMHLDFPNNHFNDGFLSIFHMEKNHTKLPPAIEIDEYKTGYGFFCFDLENTKEQGVLNPMLKGNSRLFMKFKNSLSKSITVLVYALFDSVVYIDQARNVVLREG